MKKVAEDMLPLKVIYRRKQGFTPPVKTWLDAGLWDVAKNVLLSEIAEKRGLFRKSSIENIMRMSKTFSHIYPRRVWILFMLELWFRTFIDREDIKRPMPSIDSL
jgi:asparagine synthase (glutamine-hydrolysing)